MHAKVGKELTTLLSASTLAFYAILIAFSPHRLIYDEGYYNSIAKESLKHTSALSPEFVSALSAPTGILYSIVHQIFAPLTHFDVPAARYPNLIFLAATFLMLLKWIRFGEKVSGDLAPGRFSSSLMLLAYPATGFITCLALTESSSILLATGACCLLQYGYYLSAKKAHTSSLITTIIPTYFSSGLLVGLSTLGRQNFIVLAFAVIPYFASLRKGERLICGAAFLIPIVAIFLYPILIWKGFVPPSVGFVEKGIRISSLTQTLGYTGLFCIVCFPNLLRCKVVPLPAILTISIVLSPLSMDQIRLGPLRYPIEKASGAFGLQLLQLTFACILTFFALLFLINLLLLFKKHINKRKLRPDFLFSILAILLISLSNIKITHQFSVRYITLLLPFVSYLSAFISAQERFFFPRYFLGLSASTLPVLTYFLAHA